jgi:transposase
METTILSLLVPDYILEHFELDKVETISGVIRIHLKEKKDPNHYPKSIIGKGERSLNGYMNPIEIQTFPTQGKEVFLLLKRRRWKLKGKKNSYFNSYSFCQEGMKSTKEFGAFLKEIGRG